MLPDCSQLPDWVRWIAQDSDGCWWGYEHEPNLSDLGWYENEVGRSICVTKTRPSCSWRQEIHKIERINQ